jgi:hypothetical protein
MASAACKKKGEGGCADAWAVSRVVTLGRARAEEGSVRKRGVSVLGR